MTEPTLTGLRVTNQMRDLIHRDFITVSVAYLRVRTEFSRVVFVKLFTLRIPSGPSFSDDPGKQSFVPETAWVVQQ